LSLIAAGVRYRLATGLRTAMRLWGTLLVALAVAEGLEAHLPLLRWAAEWGRKPLIGRWIAAMLAVAAIVVLLRPMLRLTMRTTSESHVEVLPLDDAHRLRIDLATVALFLLPLILGIVTIVVIGAGAIRALEALLFCCVAIVAQTLTLGRVSWSSGRSGARALAGSYEVRWLLRTGRFGVANGFALITIAGAELAIRNNDVVHMHAIAKIAGLFAALAAGILASEVARARTAARKDRVLERALPLDSTARVAALLAASFTVSVPMFIAIAILRPIALPYAICTLAALILLGEHRSLRAVPAENAVFGASAAAALLSALDARIALVVMTALVPLAWRLAIATDRTAEWTA
jgi:hypothetical protein